MNATLHHPITRAQYNALPGINLSRLKHIRFSPAKFRYLIENPTPPTPAMVFGLVCDSLMFGTEFEYRVSPFTEFRSNEARAWKAKCEEDGVPWIHADREAEAEQLITSAMSHPEIARIMAKGREQVAITAEIELPSGRSALTKSLLDWVSDSFCCVADFKTAQSAAEEDFSRQLLRMFYHVQAALYLDVYQGATGDTKSVWTWLTVESEPPFCPAVWAARPEHLELGRRVYIQWLEKYAECAARGEWPAYPGINYIDLPRWAQVKLVTSEE